MSFAVMWSVQVPEEAVVPVTSAFQVPWRATGTATLGGTATLVGTDDAAAIGDGGASLAATRSSRAQPETSIVPAAKPRTARKPSARMRPEPRTCRTSSLLIESSLHLGRPNLMTAEQA